MFQDIIPAKARQYVYDAYAASVIVVGALSIAHVNIGAAPDVLAYLGGALGFVAARNVVVAAPKQD